MLLKLFSVHLTGEWVNKFNLKIYNMLPSRKISMAVTGAALVALGIICITHPIAALVSIAWIIGLIILVSGISTFISWLSLHNYVYSSSSIFLSALLQIIAGIIFLRHDLAFASFLSLIFAFYLIFEGISLAVKSLDYRKVGFKGWWINLVLGITVAILGFMSLGCPGIPEATLSIFVGIGFITAGAVYFIAIFAVGKFEKRINKNPWIDEQ